MKYRKLLLGYLLISLLTSCSSLSWFYKKKPKIVAAPVTAIIPVAPKVIVDGAIYHDGFSTPLWEDQRARRIGDLLTVVLQESTSSSKTAKTDINKNSSIDLPSPSILGASKKLATSIDSQRAFKGDAQANQSNRLEGLITVTVSDVLPNGTLVIRGEKRITLTRGEEFIRITGLVRPADINPDNSVRSSKIGDAKITYSGTGEFAESNHVGWLTRLFNSPLWPF